ncbi:MAG: permease-like cell division protein FtsX [Gracilibacteraceae bacterium]|nr:permease-like cell division protein FtsX [Gracilibacteraceae bacterium]
MFWNSLGFVFKQSFVSLYRNFWLSFASILTSMLALTLLGFALLFLANADHFAQSMESQVEIAAFIDETVDEAGLEDIMRAVRALDAVAEVTLTTKDQGLREWIPDDAARASYLEDVGGINPIPNKITVTAREAEAVAGLAESVLDMAGVYRVNFGEDFLAPMLRLTASLRWVGLAVVAAFALATMLLISLNIKTNVQTREKEIQIMRLVGAENFLIRGPFFFEGLLIGLLGALLAIIIVGFIYTWLTEYIAANLVFVPVVSERSTLYFVLEIMAAAGMTLGAVTSAVSVRRFLKF